MTLSIKRTLAELEARVKKLEAAKEVKPVKQKTKKEK